VWVLFAYPECFEDIVEGRYFGKIKIKTHLDLIKQNQMRKSQKKIALIYGKP
jgi:hypothetical protein